MRPPINSRAPRSAIAGNGAGRVAVSGTVPAVTVSVAESPHSLPSMNAHTVQVPTLPGSIVIVTLKDAWSTGVVATGTLSSGTTAS